MKTHSSSRELDFGNGLIYIISEEIKTDRGKYFFVGAEIACGGNGLLHECTSRDGKYAIKFLTKSKSTAKKRFQREINVMRKLNGVDNATNVVYSSEVHATRKNGKRKRKIPYFIMKFAKWNLSEYMADKDYSINYSEYSGQFSGLAEALSELHKHTTHRDIKPENILISDGYWLLADYGLCSEVTRTEGITDKEERIAAKKGRKKRIGPIYWLSPEAHNRMVGEEKDRKNRIDKSSDVFQLAAVFWYVITGRHPTGTVTSKDWKLKEKTALFNFLQKCLHHHKPSRPKDGKEFLEELQIALRRN